MDTMGAWTTTSACQQQSRRARAGCAPGPGAQLHGRDSLTVVANLNSLGAIKLEQGAHKDAEAMLKESLEIRASCSGPTAPGR